MSVRSLLVQYVSRETPPHGTARITHVGGLDRDGAPWHMAVSDAISGIEDYVLRLYAMIDGVPVPIVVVARNGERRLDLVRAAGRSCDLFDLPERGEKVDASQAECNSAEVTSQTRTPTTPPASNAYRSYATLRIISRINVREAGDISDPVTRIGGTDAGGPWEMSVEEAIQSIDRFQYHFAVRVNGSTVPIMIGTRWNGRTYLKARADSEHSETLLALPRTLIVHEASDDVFPSPTHRPAVTEPSVARAPLTKHLAELQHARPGRVTAEQIAILSTLADQLREEARAALRGDQQAADPQTFARERLKLALELEDKRDGLKDGRKRE
jgi:hypothetical protein